MDNSERARGSVHWTQDTGAGLGLPAPGLSSLMHQPERLLRGRGPRGRRSHAQQGLCLPRKVMPGGSAALSTRNRVTQVQLWGAGARATEGHFLQRHVWTPFPATDARPRSLHLRI